MLTMGATEHAVAIARVSTKQQDEEDQRPGLIAYAARQDYILDEVVPVAGKSAFHGRHVKAVLAAVEKHVKNGVATVVIFRHVDRSSREGVFKGFALLNRIMEAGARIEFSEQEFLNTNPGWIGPLFELAKEESKIKQDRAIQGNTKRRATGQLIGRVPWGYDPVMGKNAKGLDIQVCIEPNALGRKWIPYIFAEVTAGKSARAIAELLTGAPSPQKDGLWGANAVIRIVTNTVYYGQMKGNPFMKFEALVTFDVWFAANLSLASRNTRGRGSTKQEPVFVKPYCANCWGQKRKGAPSGKSPMYRADRRRASGVYSYYYCWGHGSLRKSCGVQGVIVADLDAAIEHAMSTNTRPHLVREFVAGDDNAEKRKLVNEKIKAAQEAGDYLLVAQLAQEAMEIGPTERKGSSELRDSGRTVGQYWNTLTLAEKRDELATWTVIAGMNGDKLYAILDKSSPDGLGTMLIIGDLPSPSLLERAEAKGGAYF